MYAALRRSDEGARVTLADADVREAFDRLKLHAGDRRLERILGFRT